MLIRGKKELSIRLTISNIIASCRRQSCHTSLPEQDLSSGVRHDGQTGVDISRADAFVLKFDVVVDDQVCHHRLELICREETAGAVPQLDEHMRPSEELTMHVFRARMPHNRRTSSQTGA